jgi:hypothetical protein
MRDVKDMNRGDSSAGGDSGSEGSDPESQDRAASPEDGSLVRKLRELNGDSHADAAASPDGAPMTPKAPLGGGPTAGVGAGAEAGAGSSIAGAGGAATGAGGAVAGGAEAMAAAGAAESSTGVGAAIGIPTLLAAGTMAAAEKAKDMGEAAARLGAAGGEYAAGGMDDEAERYGG